MLPLPFTCLSLGKILGTDGTLRLKPQRKKPATGETPVCVTVLLDLD